MELHKKVIGNAVSAYFLFLVSIFFLWNKTPYINDPFVKSHTKVAFSLHILLIIMLFLMSYPILDNISIFHYSLNSLLTAFMGITIFSGILYGAYKAHLGETVTLGEMFHKTGVQKQILSQSSTHEIGEEVSMFLVGAHIPFLGYTIAAQHQDVSLIRNISLLNLIITLFCVLLYIFGLSSLANIIMLAYIIWSVIQSIRLITQHELTHIDIDMVPTPQEKYILLRSFIHYLPKLMHSQKQFINFQTLKIQEEEKLKMQIKADNEKVDKLKTSPFPTYLFYIPFINLIGLFFLRSKDQFHIKNGLGLSVISILILGLIGVQEPLGILLLFPIFYGIGYSRLSAYRMPYIYDSIHFFGKIIFGVTHIFHKTQELQKKNIQETTKIGEEKKEA